MAIVTGITKDKMDAINAPVLSGTSMNVAGVLKFTAEDGSYKTIGQIKDDLVDFSEAITLSTSTMFPSPPSVIPQWRTNQVSPVVLSSNTIGDMPYSVEFSPDSNMYVYLSNSSTTPVSIGVRKGDIFTIGSGYFTAGDPTIEYRVAAWSPDGNYLALGGDGSNKLVIYSFNGSKFTSYTTVTGIGEVVSITWSPDSQAIIAAETLQQYPLFLVNNGSSFVAAHDTGLGPLDPSVRITACHWSSNQKYFALGLNVAPFVRVYKVTKSGIDLAIQQLSNPSTDLSSAPSCLKWSPNGKYLAASCGTAPNRYGFYTRLGDVISYVSSIPDTYNPLAPKISWTPDSLYLAVVGETGVSTYSPGSLVRRFGDILRVVDNQLSNTIDTTRKVSWTPDGLHACGLIHLTPYKRNFVKSSMTSPDGVPTTIQIAP